MQLDKSSIVNGEELVVTVFGVTAQMVEDGAYVACFKKDRKHTEFGEYHLIKKEGTSRITFTDTQLVSGDWEIRLFRNGWYGDEDFITSVPFTIRGK
jgi:hypothetical protein